MVENLVPLHQVAKDAKTVPWSDREESVIKLLRCWLTQYSLHHAWRLETTGNTTVLHCHFIYFRLFSNIFDLESLNEQTMIQETSLISVAVLLSRCPRVFWLSPAKWPVGDNTQFPHS